MNTETDSQTPSGAPATNGGDPTPAASAGAEARAGAAAPRAPDGAAPEAAAPEGPEVELAKLRERLLRMAADFDNYRKRSRRDIADAEHRVQESLLRQLLPTFDNLERAAAHAGSASDVKALADGIKMVMRQFQDTLASMGIERVATQGKPFDPAEHEAVQHVQSDTVPPGAIVQELQGGYRWQGRLMRPALVVVSKARSSSAGDEPEDA